MNINDFLASDVFKKLHQEKAEVDLRRQQEARHTALVVTTLTQHPGWTWFLREAETLRAQAQASHDALRDEMARGETLGEPLTVLKLRLHRTWGAIEALDALLVLVPTALRRGDMTDAAADAESDRRTIV